MSMEMILLKNEASVPKTDIPQAMAALDTLIRENPILLAKLVERCEKPVFKVTDLVVEHAVTRNLVDSKNNISPDIQNTILSAVELEYVGASSGQIERVIIRLVDPTFFLESTKKIEPAHPAISKESVSSTDNCFNDKALSIDKNLVYSETTKHSRRCCSECFPQ